MELFNSGWGENAIASLPYFRSFRCDCFTGEDSARQGLRFLRDDHIFSVPAQLRMLRVTEHGIQIYIIIVFE